ncbi:MAG TPA: hypothetical protein DDW36_03325 [Candidatus Magasanikbacteria bacterium]|nr:hypothetical protein [Candidatus Magasanikbacteria bacterium]
MLAAAEMIKRSGCAKHPVGAVLVRGGLIIGRGANGSMRADTRHTVCERVRRGCKTGEGYELCPNCITPGHVEPMTIADARACKQDTNGADLYLFGHWWCCEPCWKIMAEAGIKTVYLVTQATELFDRPEGTKAVLQEMGIAL